MVGSSSRSAPAALAAAASVSRAAARSPGLSRRPASSRLSTVAPSGALTGWARAGGQANRLAASIVPAPSRIHWAPTSLHQVSVDSPADGVRLPLHLGGQMQRPRPPHPGVHLEPLDPVLAAQFLHP